MTCQLVDLTDSVALHDIVQLLLSQRIVVLTGAGISTSAGIPDFRSAAGLYQMKGGEILHAVSRPRDRGTSFKSPSTIPTTPQPPLQKLRLRNSPTPAPPAVRGRDLCHVSVLAHPDTAAFFRQFIARLRSKARSLVTATTTHHFIAELAQTGRLVRCYTQNIDGLEEHVGLQIGFPTLSENVAAREGSVIGPPQVVQLHGGVDSVLCSVCSYTGRWTDQITACFEAGEAPLCEQCAAMSDRRRRAGKRALSRGRLRPNILLYGETHHPHDSMLSRTMELDMMAQPAVLLIMGTSLRVQGCKTLVENLGFGSARPGRTVLYVNQEPPSGKAWLEIIDKYFVMDCEKWVEAIRKALPTWEQQKAVQGCNDLIGDGEMKDGSDITFFDIDDGSPWQGRPLKPRTAAEDCAWLDGSFPGN